MRENCLKLFFDKWKSLMETNLEKRNFYDVVWMLFDRKQGKFYNLDFKVFSNSF